MKNPLRKQAILAGISLLVMAVAAAYSYGYVHGNLIILDDPSSTLHHLNHAPGMFGSGILAWLVILIADLLVAYALYKFFVPVHSKVSLATGSIRALYSAVLAFAIYQLIKAWQMLPSSNQEAMALIDLVKNFETYWSLGLLLFGLHLVGLGYLSIQSKTVPAWLGWLLGVAGLSYTGINMAKALFPEAADTITTVEMILAAPMTIAELGLAVWLLAKGGTPKKLTANRAEKG